MNRPIPFVSSFALLLLGLAACGGGGSGGGGGGNPPPDTAVVPTSLGLVSAAAGNGAVRVAWDATDAQGSAVAVALFRSTSSSTVYSGAPIATANGAGAQTVTSLPNGVEQFFGLAVDLGGGQYSATGAVFRARPKAPVYVDAASTAVAPDGASPATAFPTVAAGVQAAANQGGGNVWIAEGTYNGVALTLTTGVDLYGGFTTTFDVATRDPEAHPSLLRGAAGLFVLELAGGGAPLVLDGLTIDGRNLASFGLDIDSTEARVSACEVFDTTSHGLRLRSTSASGSVDVDLVGSRVHDCGGEGVSVLGTFDLGLYGSRFSANRNEGASLGQLVAPNGIPASLHVQDCVFFGNGEDGLDCQLGRPPVVAGSSSYRVRVERSLFERNGWLGVAAPAGLRIDLDFELVNGWSADVLVRGCTARANKGDGFALDLDATSTTFLHRLLATANGGDGVRVTSETTAGLAVMTHSAMVGNLGAGTRAALGNVPVAAAHCIFAGNAGGGLVSSSVTSTAAACVASLQPTPYTGVREDFGVTVTDALTALFTNAPVEYARVASADATNLTLSAAGSFAAGDPVEVADDATSRAIAGFGAPTQLQLTPHPTSVDVPASLMRFAVGSGVVEDFTLAPGSAALASGLPAPTGLTQDAGVFGGALGGEPGFEAGELPALFRPSSSSPAPTTALGANTTILVSFQGGTLASGSITGQVRARNQSGTLLAITAGPSGSLLSIQAPGGGWPSGDVVVELHAGLASTAGDALPCPIALTFHRP
ncbi:MAG: right-handed parallel beta-helix repeat-containing protein [Planctomycetes bacterium]|nr:right-handed parallel beta-helix repeat-containing protein [Planctomycetota bacterium]